MADILAEHGYNHISTGDLVRAYVKQTNGTEPTRPEMKVAADGQRALHGGDYWVRLALRPLSRYIVVSGIRTADEANCLKDDGGTLVWIEAPIELRFQRLVGRGRTGDNLTFAEFKAQEEAEAHGTKSSEQSVATLERLADVRIVNDGDPAALRRVVTEKLLGE